MRTMRPVLALISLFVPAGIICYWADRDGPPLESVGHPLLLAASTVANAREGRRVASATKAHELQVRKQADQQHREDDREEHGKPGEEPEEIGSAQEEEGENEGEHEKEVTPLMFTVAVLIGLFLFANVGLLYLVNYQDENVRSSIYKMISSTMSIFLAVTLNAAIFSLFLEQLLPSPPPRGFNIKVTPLVEFLVGLVIFVSASLAVNILGCKWSSIEDEERFFVLKTIGGHITAFAGITTFGTLQVVADARHTWWQGHHYAVVVISGCVLVVLRFIAGWFRESVMMEKPTKEVRVAQFSNDASAEEVNTEWAEEMCESEDEAHSLILSFLLSRIAVWKVTGRIVPLHDSEEPIRHPTHDILHMLSFLPYGLLVLLGVVLVREYIEPIERLGGKDPTKFYMRALNNLQTVSAVTMSWFTCIVGFWLTQLLLEGTQLDSMEMAKVLNAFSLTLFAIGAIIVVDKIADYLGDRKTDKVVSFDDKEHFKHLEKLLRTVIDSFALLVGLLWELASDASIETIIEGNPHLSHHRVLSKIGIAAMMFCFVFTAWLKYIVPPAKKSSDDHKGDMLMEEMQQFAGRDAKELAETMVEAITLRLKNKLKIYPQLLGKVVHRLQGLQEQLETNSSNVGSEQRSHSA
eukprot:TRINITY_DN19487_c0_g1_i1.p1 TRINITY_DN19487_c0_g1~~TRINITY_DN19487_c0_g1_i1.p1  ORF type:complete len:636 (-),score=110.65 TRINITY_DN19487_c0_g1_i1:111-2018(-)